MSPLTKAPRDQTRSSRDWKMNAINEAYVRLRFRALVMKRIPRVHCYVFWLDARLEQNGILLLTSCLAEWETHMTSGICVMSFYFCKGY